MSIFQIFYLVWLSFALGKEPLKGKGSDEDGLASDNDDLSNNPKNIDGVWFPPLPTSSPGPLKKISKNSAYTLLKQRIAKKSAPKMDDERDILDKLQNLKDADKPKIATLIKKLPPITPSIEKPWNPSEWDRFQVKLEAFYRENLLGKNETPAHPVSRNYPGSPDKPAPLDAALKATIRLDKNRRYEILLNNSCSEAPTVLRLKKSGMVSCPKFCATTKYAEPGKLIRVNLGTNKVTSFTIRIGHFTVDTSNLGTWTQYPNMRTIKTFNASDEAQEYTIHSVFGGLIYIGNVNHEVGLETLNLSISGGVRESPHYIHKEIHLAEWREEKQKIKTPWGDLISPQVILTLPYPVLQKIDDPEELLMGWERIVDGINEVAQLPYKESRVHIAVVRDLPKGVPLVMPGNPVLIKEDAGTQLTQLQKLWDKTPNMYGILHAVAHNFQDHFDVFQLTPKSGEPLHNEIIVNYIKNVVHVTPMEKVRKEYKLENIQRAVTAYMEKANYNDFLKQGMIITWFFDLHRNFGWTTFMQLAKAFRGRKFKDYKERIDALYVEMSKLEGKNLRNYFSSWGLAVSSEAKAQVKGLPDSPLEIKDLLEYCGEKLRPVGTGRGLTTKKNKKEEFLPEEITEDDMKGEDLDAKIAKFQENFERFQESRQEGRGFSKGDGSKAHLFQPLSGGDYERLTNGVNLVKYFSCYQLALLSETTTPVLWGLKNFKPEKISPCIAASISSTTGSRAVFTGCQYMYYGYDDQAEKFLANILMWVGNYKGDPSTFKALSIETNLTASHTFNVRKLARNGGLDMNIVQHTKVKPEDFQGVNVLVVRSLDFLTEEVTKMIEKYLQTGGGIFANVEDPEMMNTDYPAKRITKAFGIVFVDRKVYHSVDAGYKVGGPIPPGLKVLDAARSAMDVLQQRKVVSPTELQTSANSLELGILATSGEKAPWKDRLKQAFLSGQSIMPTANQSMKVTDALRQKITIEEVAMQLLEPKDKYKHPSADIFPGPVPQASYSGKKFNGILQLERKPSDIEVLLEENCVKPETLAGTDISCTDWCPTGFYAPAGSTVKVTFDSKVVSSFSVFTGRFETVLHLPEYKKYPKIEYQKSFLSNAGVFNSPFGGPVMFGQVKAPKNVSSVKFSIEEAAEMPHFFLGQTRLSEWQRLRKLDTPWFIITGQTNEIKFPKYVIKDLDDPEALALVWDRMLDAFNEFHETPYRKHKEWLNFDHQVVLNGPLMVSLKVSAKMHCAETAVSVSAMSHNHYIALLYLHEWGHNWDLQWWKFAGGYQVTNEINQFYVKSTLHGFAMDKIHAIMQPNMAAKILEKYLKTGPNYQQVFNNKDDLDYDFYMQCPSRLFYLDLGRNYGWAIYMKMALLEKSQKVTFPDDDFRRDWALEQLSLIIKRDLTDYFASWGLRTSSAAQGKVRHLPKAKENVNTLRSMLKKQEAAYTETLMLSTVAKRYFGQNGNLAQNEFAPYITELEKELTPTTETLFAECQAKLNESFAEADKTIQSYPPKVTELLGKVQAEITQVLSSSDKGKNCSIAIKKKVRKMDKLVPTAEAKMEKAVELVKKAFTTSLGMMAKNISMTVNSSLPIIVKNVLGKPKRAKYTNPNILAWEQEIQTAIKQVKEVEAKSADALKFLRPVQAALEIQEKRTEAVMKAREMLSHLKVKLAKETGKWEYGLPEQLEARLRKTGADMITKLEADVKKHYESKILSAIQASLKKAAKDLSKAEKTAAHEGKENAKKCNATSAS